MQNSKNNSIFTADAKIQVKKLEIKNCTNS